MDQNFNVTVTTSNIWIISIYREGKNKIHQERRWEIDVCAATTMKTIVHYKTIQIVNNSSTSEPCSINNATVKSTKKSTKLFYQCYQSNSSRLSVPNPSVPNKRRTTVCDGGVGPWAVHPSPCHCARECVCALF